MTLSERTEYRNRLQADADQTMAINAYWDAEASRVRAAKKAVRDAETAGRRELVAHLMRPGAVAEVLMARARFSVPVVAADRPMPNQICWMPRGTHEINANTMNGGTWSGAVVCDAVGAAAVIASHAAATKDGWRAFIDFAHRNEGAAAWIAGFSWDPSIGIMASVLWTSAGETAVRDRIFTSFSPTFTVDYETGRVTGIMPGMASGALVNSPAFGSAMPAISACGRIGAADAVHEALVSSGISAAAADVVATAIRSGRDGQAIVALLKAIS